MCHFSLNIYQDFKVVNNNSFSICLLVADHWANRSSTEESLSACFRRKNFPRQLFHLATKCEACKRTNTLLLKGRVRLKLAMLTKESVKEIQTNPLHIFKLYIWNIYIFHKYFRTDLFLTVPLSSELPTDCSVKKLPDLEPISVKCASVSQYFWTPKYLSTWN